MKKLLILLLGLLALALLGYFCVYKKHAPAIQSDIQTRATTALADAGFDWAKISVDGRNITLTGIVPSEADKAKAGELAEVDGYHLVDNQITVAQTASEKLTPVPEPKPHVTAPSPYTMKAELDASGQVLLTGYVPDTETHTRIVKLAQDQFGATKIIDRLKEITGAPDSWLQSVDAGLINLQRLDEGVAEWEDLNLRISGNVASESVKTQITDQLKAALPDGYVSRLNLMAPAPSVIKPAPQMTVEEKVSAISCQDQFSGLLSNSVINFRTASAKIAIDSHALLDQLAIIARECPAANITIEGHTDSSGTELFNQQLSQNRAQSVVDYLVNQGVEANRLTAVGFGESSPIADNNTSEGRAQNRRIEFTVKGI